MPTAGRRASLPFPRRERETGLPSPRRKIENGKQKMGENRVPTTCAGGLASYAPFGAKYLVPRLAEERVRSIQCACPASS